MSGAGAWLVQALAASALLMAVVLVGRRPVRRMFGPEIAYALWALPALRILLPPLPAAWHAAPSLAAAGDTVTVMIVDAGPAASAPALSLGAVLLGVWAAGAVLLLGWQIERHRRFRRRLLAAATSMEVTGGVTIVASTAAPGPLAFGVHRRYVALPADAARRYAPAERALALAHELAHHARGDLHANWAALVVLALHWWNPLAWIALRAFRADQELATDACVLAGRPAAEAHAYACAIVKAASPLASAAPAACLHSVTDLKRRLQMLSTRRASRRHLAAGAAVTALLTGAGLVLTATSSAAATAVAKMDAALQDAAPPLAAAPPVSAQGPAVPMPPTAPAAPAAPRKVKRVVVVRNGESRTFEGPAADAWLHDHPVPVPPAPSVPPPGEPAFQIYSYQAPSQPGSPRVVRREDVPQVVNRRCGGGDQPVVEQQRDGAKRLVVICTDRMTRMSANAERAAAAVAGTERGALASAQVNLAGARAAIERDRNLSEAQRREALAGIAQAERELRADAAKAD